MNALGMPDLKQLEKQAYHSIWDDGLIDIIVGIALFLIGIFWVSEDSGYGAIVAPILVPFWTVARSRISIPRRGAVNLSPERVGKEKMKLTGLLLFGVVTFAIGVVWYVVGGASGSLRAHWVSNIVAALPAMLVAIMAIIVAFTFELRRFLIYAAVLLVSGVALILLDLRPGWGFLPASVVCLSVGSYILFRFLRKYPNTD